MAATRQSGPGMLLPINFPVFNRLTPGVQALQGAGPVSLAAGQVELVPAGQWHLQLGAYTFLQVKDAITGVFRTIGTLQQGIEAVLSDGQNFRIANLSGCAVGSFITNVGTGYTSAPTVTASAGSSVWRAIVGGAINSTVTITTAGSGYTYPPLLLIDPPPAGGVQATAICTISAGAIASVVVINQGAGYAAVPVITIIPDPRDTSTTIVTGVLTINATLAGATTVTAIICTDHGTPLTAVPTFSITGGGGASAAATAVMCFTATAFAVTNAGAAYTSAPYLILTGGGVVAGTAGAVVNPELGPALFTPRQAVLNGAAGTTLVIGGQTISDGGIFQSVPTGFVLNSGTAVQTTNAAVTITVGGVSDTSYIYPA